MIGCSLCDFLVSKPQIMSVIPYQLIIRDFEKKIFLKFGSVLAMKQNPHGRNVLVCFKCSTRNTFIIDLGLIVYPHHQNGPWVSEEKDFIEKNCLSKSMV